MFNGQIKNHISHRTQHRCNQMRWQSMYIHQKSVRHLVHEKPWTDQHLNRVNNGAHPFPIQVCTTFYYFRLSSTNAWEINRYGPAYADNKFSFSEISVHQLNVCMLSLVPMHKPSSTQKRKLFFFARIRWRRTESSPAAACWVARARRCGRRQPRELEDVATSSISGRL